MSTNRQEKLLEAALRLLEAAVPISLDPALLAWCVANDVMKEPAVDRLETLLVYGIELLEGKEPVTVDADAIEIPKVVIATAQVVIMKVAAEDKDADVTGNAMDKWVCG